PLDAGDTRTGCRSRFYSGAQPLLGPSRPKRESGARLAGYAAGSHCYKRRDSTTRLEGIAEGRTPRDGVPTRRCEVPSQVGGLIASRINTEGRERTKRGGPEELRHPV